MDFRTVGPEELEEALAVAGETVSAERLAMYEHYPDLFTCCCDGGRINGGWRQREQSQKEKRRHGQT